jgi:hypothetical protein
MAARAVFPEVPGVVAVVAHPQAVLGVVAVVVV